MKRKQKSELSEILLQNIQKKIKEDDWYNILYAVYKKEMEIDYIDRDREYIMSFKLDCFDCDDADMVQEICEVLNKKWCSDWEIEEEGHYHISWEVKNDYLHLSFKY